MELSQRLSAKEPAHDHLNTLLTQQIGYGYAQQKLSRPLYLLLFSQGCQTIALGLLLPILTEEWQLSTLQQSMLITVVYLGVTVGSYVQIYSDRYGRYNFVTYDAILQTVFGLFSCICWNYQSFLVARFFYGIGIGICLPLSASYITEISPGNMRATLLSKSRVYWSAGCLFSCILGWLLLQDQAWRLMLLAICIPGLYAWYEHWREGRESLRYLWVQKRKEEVCSVVDLMCDLNEKPRVEHSYILSLMEADDREDHVIEDIPSSELLNHKYYSSTIRLVVSWMTVCFIYYGIMLLLPTILTRVFVNANKDPNFKYIFLIIIAIVEVGGFYIASYIMDHPQIGRKKGVYYGMFLVCASSLVILICGQSMLFMLFLALSIIKLIISATFMVLYPYTAQIYETMLRGKALGIFSACGRVSTMFVGVVGVYAMEWFNGNGLYVIFLVLSGLAGLGAKTMPYCTSGRSIS